MIRPSKDEYFLTLVEGIAARATCRRRKVGAILVDSRGAILSTGYNGVPFSQPHCLDEPCAGAGASSGSALDLCEAIHAEQNALIFCPDVRLIDTIYATASSCVFCTRMLLNTPCRRMVFPVEYPHPRAKELWLRAGREWCLIKEGD